MSRGVRPVASKGRSHQSVLQPCQGTIVGFNMSHLPPITSQKSEDGHTAVRPARLHARAGSNMPVAGARGGPQAPPVQGQHTLNPHTLLQVTELVQSDLPAPKIIVRSFRVS
jgi:hypothetical protein